MRLIDADALYYKVKCECNPYGKPTIDFESGKKVLDWIEEAPTFEEKPHGEWINNGHCSKCGGHAPFWLLSSGYYKSNFCPDCGASMEVVE